MRITRRTVSISAVILAVVAMLRLMLLGPGSTNAQGPLLDPNEVRSAAIQAGLDSLGNVIISDPGGLPDFLNLGAGPGGIDPTARQAAIQLGKALFWDRQVGSDGQACASCHFVAFADDRTKNQLSPNLRNTDPQERVLFNATASGDLGGPNYDMTVGDFPLHQLADPLEENYMEREVAFDSDDVMSSQGVFAATFAGVPPPNMLVDLAIPLADPDGFQVDDGAGNLVNVRRVEPRNTPSNVNALFNFHNFWDGRASFFFNGVDVIGPLSTLPFIWSNTGGALTQNPVGPLGVLAQGSLASQAVGPPENFEEMSFANRQFPDVGRKMLQGPTVYSSYPYSGNNTGDLTQTRRPMQFQEVADTDSHFSQLLLGIDIDEPGAGVDGLDIAFPTSEIPFFKGPDGIFGTADDPVPAPTNMPMYQALVQIAFQPRWWNAPATGVIDPVLEVPQQQLINGYSLMEQNFALFYGIAVQMYEMTLRADRTAFDLFMEGDSTYGTTGKGTSFGFADIPGGLTADQQLLQARLKGLLTFIKTDQFFQQTNPVFNGINDGNCIFCHGGPELTNASLAGLAEIEFEIEVQLDHGRLVQEHNQLGFEEDAFNNIGVRPSREDLGRAGRENGFTLSAVEAFFKGTPGGLPPPPVVVSPNPFRVLDDGAFKVPLLRNVELTGPYFHNGGELTLAQVVQFYIRTGDFADVNVKDIEPNLASDLILIEEGDTPFLVHFLLSLTDERLRLEQAPFDHPEIQVPNGHPGSNATLSGTGTTPLGVSTTGTTQVLTTGPLGDVVVAADNLRIIPAVGAEGVGTPIDNFLGISSTPVVGPNNDHFDPQPPVVP